jgi:hypothetical protein
MRFPDGQRLAVGYVQAGGDVHELEDVEASEQVSDDGLVTSARLGLRPPGVSLDFEPLAYGPLRLVSRDGRATNFPRAMCRLRTNDDRMGLGWAEWNLNLSQGS